MYHSSTLIWYRCLKFILGQDKGISILHSQYYGCWWHARSQGMSDLSIVLILHVYFDLSTRKVKLLMLNWAAKFKCPSSAIISMTIAFFWCCIRLYPCIVHTETVMSHVKNFNYKCSRLVWLLEMSPFLNTVYLVPLIVVYFCWSVKKILYAFPSIQLTEVWNTRWYIHNHWWNICL